MIRKPFVRLFIFLEYFLHPFLHPAIHVNVFPVPLVHPFQHEKSLPMPDTLRVGQIEITLAHGEMIHGVQYIRFPHPVIPDKTIKSRAKSDTCLGDILVVDNIQIL